MDDFDADWDAATGGSLMPDEWLSPELDAFGTNGFSDDLLTDPEQLKFEEDWKAATNGSLMPGEWMNSDIESFNTGLSSGTASTGGGTGLLNQALGFIKQNPKAAEWMAAGIAGIAASNRADKNAGRTEEERLRTRQRISDSIVGMKPMQSGKQTPMKRIDGSRVYDQNGKPL